MEFVAAFILALLISLVFAVRSTKGASFTQLIIFFFILFMSGLAGQYWLVPFGPVWQGVAWLPLLVILLIVTLLFASPLPGYHHKKANVADPSEPGAPAAIFAGVFIWVLLFILLVAVLVGYAKKSNSSPVIPEKTEITYNNFNL